MTKRDKKRLQALEDAACWQAITRIGISAVVTVAGLAFIVITIIRWH